MSREIGDSVSGEEIFTEATSGTKGTLFCSFGADTVSLHSLRICKEKTFNMLETKMEAYKTNIISILQISTSELD